MWLALVAHIVAAAAFVAMLVLGPGRTVEYGLQVLRAAKGVVKREATRLATAREARIEASLGAAAPDVFRFAPLPDARTASLGYGRVLRVGPGAKYKQPQQAARAARDGDVIEIEAGEYRGGTAIWGRNDLLIRARGGVARLDAEGVRLPQNKAIWVITGDNVRVENIEFSNARSRDRNGAGIRAEGDRLHVVSCYFHGNESGLMTDNDHRNRLRVERSEFARNGHPSGQAHQIYVGQIDEFALEGCYIHETNIGSAVKSRARRSIIQYNRIVDEGRGRSNYTIDLSVGGEGIILGNVLQQGAATGNYTLVTYAPEGMPWRENRLLVLNNTFVNDRDGGNFIRNHSPETITVANNLLVGDGSPLQGPGILTHNLVDHGKGFFGRFDDALGGLAGSGGNRFAEDVGVTGRAAYDYRLRAGSPAIDAAAPLAPEVAKALHPLLEYHHPLEVEKRAAAGAPDIGALEYAP